MPSQERASLSVGTWDDRSSPHSRATPRLARVNKSSEFIPPLASCRDRASQTLKDVSRERFDVNKEPTDPSRCWSCIRALLLEAAIQTLNHQKQHNNDHHNQGPLDTMARPADAAALQPDTGGPRIATDSAAAPGMRAKKKGFLEAAAVAVAECPSVGEAHMGHMDHMGPESAPPAADARPDTSPADAAAGGNGSTGKLAVEVEGGGGSRDVDACITGEGGCVGCGGPPEEDACARASKSPVEVYVDQCAWRVLHAASRTASGGDSFFVVQVRSNFAAAHGPLHGLGMYLTYGQLSTLMLYK